MIKGHFSLVFRSFELLKNHKGNLKTFWSSFWLFFSPHVELWVVCKNGTPVMCIHGHTVQRVNSWLYTPYSSRCLNLTLLLKHPFMISIHMKSSEAEREMSYRLHTFGFFCQWWEKGKWIMDGSVRWTFKTSSFSSWVGTKSSVFPLSRPFALSEPLWWTTVIPFR